MTTRDLPAYRDVAVILIDQLKEVYIDGLLDMIDTANYYTKIMRKDYAIGVQYSESGVDDPDQQFYENYVCGSDRNYTGYCDPELDKLVDRQSSEADTGKRRQLVWEIERKLAEDGSRPVIFYTVSAACAQPYFKGHRMMTNSVYNSWRMDDVWLDR